jgi:hypothetical protein
VAATGASAGTHAVSPGSGKPEIITPPHALNAAVATTNPAMVFQVFTANLPTGRLAQGQT